MNSEHPAERIVLHVDMDAFFAAVEERVNSSLKGKPVVIGSDPKGGRGRGIVATANYAARRYGIGSALPISTAFRRCPHAIFLRPRFQLYRTASRRIMDILRADADALEQVSIDEAYLDVSSRGTFEAARSLAASLQKKILKEEHLSASIGVGPNKLIAKIASDHKKPAGITVVIPNRVREFLDPLSVRVLRGVGPKTGEHLRAMGFETVSQLSAASEKKLAAEFGKFGGFLWSEVRGIDDRPVDSSWEAKSMSREHTYQEDTDDPDELNRTLLSCVARVHADMTGDGLWCHTLTVKVRYSGFETHSKQTTLKQPSGDLEHFRLAAVDLLAPFLEKSRAVRLVGFGVSKLVPPEDLLPLKSR